MTRGHNNITSAGCSGRLAWNASCPAACMCGNSAYCGIPACAAFKQTCCWLCVLGILPGCRLRTAQAQMYHTVRRTPKTPTLFAFSWQFACTVFLPWLPFWHLFCLGFAAVNNTALFVSLRWCNAVSKCGGLWSTVVQSCSSAKLTHRTCIVSSQFSHKHVQISHVCLSAFSANTSEGAKRLTTEQGITAPQCQMTQLNTTNILRMPLQAEKQRVNTHGGLQSSQVSAARFSVPVTALAHLSLAALLRSLQILLRQLLAPGCSNHTCHEL